MIISRLAEIMGRERIRASELHRRTGVARSTIGRLWHGRAEGIDFQTLNKLCKALHCTPGDLLGYVPDDEKSGR